MSYRPSRALLLAAESFLKTAYVNESEVLDFLNAALRAPNHPCVHNGLLITTNYSDLYGDDDEFHVAPSFKRAQYAQYLKRDSKHKSITTTEEMVVAFIDPDRQFRIDFSFHIVLLTEHNESRAIDLIDFAEAFSFMNPQAESFMIGWLVEEKSAITASGSEEQKDSGLFKVVVDNAA